MIALDTAKRLAQICARVANCQMTNEDVSFCREHLEAAVCFHPRAGNAADFKVFDMLCKAGERLGADYPRVRGQSNWSRVVQSRLSPESKNVLDELAPRFDALASSYSSRSIQRPIDVPLDSTASRNDPRISGAFEPGSLGSYTV